MAGAATSLPGIVVPGPELTVGPSIGAPAPVAPAASGPLGVAGDPVSPTARSLRELEREGIVAALAATGGNKAQAAAILEIDRSTLYKKLKEYGIG